MQTFRELLEKLMIKQKTSKDVTSFDYGKIERYDIVNSKHASDDRNGTTRNDGMNIKLLKSIIREFIYSVDTIKDGKYDIIYKNPKFNKLVIGVKANKITIITVIQVDRNANTFKEQENQTQIELTNIFEDMSLIVSVFYEEEF